MLGPSLRMRKKLEYPPPWADGGPILDVYRVNTQITTKPLHATIKTHSNPDKLKHCSSHAEQNMGQHPIFDIDRICMCKSHADVSSRDSCLILGLSVDLHPYFV